MDLEPLDELYTYFCGFSTLVFPHPDFCLTCSSEELKRFASVET